VDEDQARVAALTTLREELDGSSQLQLVREFEGVRRTYRVFLGTSVS
jgi:hypothetical protein